MKPEIKKIIKPFKNKKGALISILQQIQKKYEYLSQDAISTLADELKLSEHEIYGVATFYSQFKFDKPGKHQVKVCLGTACHVGGGGSIMETVERDLGIKYGETTENGRFSLERVACMGCCALSPVIVIDGIVHGKISQRKLVKLLKEMQVVEDGE